MNLKNKNILYLLFVLVYLTITTNSFGMSTSLEKIDRITSQAKHNLSTSRIEASNFRDLISVKKLQQLHQKRFETEINTFLNSLNDNERHRILDVAGQIVGSHENFVKIQNGNRNSIVILVQGLDLPTTPSTYFKPIQSLINWGGETYFFKWNKHLSLDENALSLTKWIKNVKIQNSEKDIVIIAYSAGGIISLLSMRELQKDGNDRDTYLHTVASPIYGYKAPFIAYLGVPFVGKSSIEIGIGRKDLTSDIEIQNTTQWVTTNCEMDQHACNYNGINPQRGLINNFNESPYNQQELKIFDDESHASILSTVIDEILYNLN